MFRIHIAFLCLIVGKNLYAQQTEPVGEPGEIRIVKRVLESDQKTLDHEIGVLFVRENRSVPDSRVIGVGFSRYPAKAPSGPPIFMLPGGPGQSYVEPTDRLLLAAQIVMSSHFIP